MDEKKQRIILSGDRVVTCLIDEVSNQKILCENILCIA